MPGDLDRRPNPTMTEAARAYASALLAQVDAALGAPDEPPALSEVLELMDNVLGVLDSLRSLPLASEAALLAGALAQRLESLLARPWEAGELDEVRRRAEPVLPLLPEAHGLRLEYVMTRRWLEAGAALLADVVTVGDRYVTAAQASVTDDPWGAAVALVERAIQWERLGDAAASQRDLTLADAALVKLPTDLPTGVREHVKDLRLTIAYARANVCSLLNRHEEALKEFDRLAAAGGRFVQPGLAGAAASAAELGRRDVALDRLAELEERFTADPDDAVGEQLPAVRADVLLLTGDPAGALASLDGAWPLPEEPTDLELRWRTRWTRARALVALEKRSAALKHVLAAARTADLLNGVPLGYRLDSTALRGSHATFTTGVMLAADLGRAVDCAILMDLVKGRVLSRVLRTRPDAATPEQDARDDEIDRLTAQIESAEVALADGNARVADRSELLVRRATKVAERQRLDPRWRQLTEPRAEVLPRLPHWLSERRLVAIGLFLDGSRLTAVALGHGGEPDVAYTDLSPNVIERLERYIEAVSSEADVPVRSLDPAVAGLAVEDFIPPRIVARADGAAAVLISPHGRLHLLPWGSLPVHQGGPRLITIAPVGVVPNLESIPALAREDAVSAIPRAAILAPPDPPGAVAEGRILAGLYAARGRLITEPLLGIEATAEAFRRIVAEGRGTEDLLHVACHASADPEEPSRSLLELAGPSAVDAAEISRRQLAFGEVVLNACSTGWRPAAIADVPLLGDDVLALPGALLEAGVKALLVSIPLVRDTAAEQMGVAYHRARLTGEAPLSAFRMVMTELLAGTAEPGEWCGYVMYGGH